MKIYTNNDSEIVAINNESEVFISYLKRNNLKLKCLEIYMMRVFKVINMNRNMSYFSMRKEATQGMKNHEGCCTI